MAVTLQAGPRAKRPCIKVILKGMDSLKERYPEVTADVFFVDGETKESLPAHREVLKVASSVFFRMFEGNWKEKRERRIQAPEEYKWESFKAAIALLYGEEVEVEESSIPDIVRIAHLYDLTRLMCILAQHLCQWGDHLLGTVVKLCAIAGDFPEGNNDLLSAAVKHIARRLEKVDPSDITHFSCKAMQILVQSEAVTSAECVLLRTLNQWTHLQMDITLRQVQQLYSHIRFGTIPFEDLTECSDIGHDYLKSALKNHQHLVVENVRNNLVQITPRLAQKEVFQVYPMAQGVRAVVQQNGKIKVSNVSCNPGFGIIYCGKQDIRFQLSLTTKASHLECILFSLHNHLASICKVESALVNTLSQRCKRAHDRTVLDNSVNTTLEFRKCTVALHRTGAHIMLQSTGLPGLEACATIERTLSCTDDFPWVLTFGVTNVSQNNPLMLQINSSAHFTIHPPTL